jgi:hypothetical protein
MSNLSVNTITNAAGGNTAQINGMTPTAQSLQGFRNRILNGGMVIDQRNAGASVTGGVGYTFPVDRFRFYSASASKLSGQRSTVAPNGFTNSMLLTSLAATTPAAGDEYHATQNIEGFNVADLGFGTASAQSVTLSFEVRSSLTGTFAGSLSNANGSRAYVFTYTISAANTWEQKTITVAGDTSGTWGTENGTGLRVLWDLGSGSNYNGTAGVWAGSFVTRTSGAVSVVGTSGATFYITGVQLEAGSVATPFERRPYGTELALCQRYFENFVVPDGSGGYLGMGMLWSTNQGRLIIPYKVPKRAAPTNTASGTLLFGDSTGTGVMTSFSFDASSVWSVLLFGSFASGSGTQGRAAQAYVASPNGFTFSASAEL